MRKELKKVLLAGGMFTTGGFALTLLLLTRAILFLQGKVESVYDWTEKMYKEMA